MIYSNETEKRCGLCRYAKIDSEDDNFFCEKRKKSIPPTTKVCRHYSYDILKRTVRRRKPLQNDFSPEDFSL